MEKLRAFVGRAWPLLLFGFVSVFWGNFGQSFFIGVYGESFKSSLNLSAGEYGSIYSLATFLAGFVFLFAGAWIDKLPLKPFSIATGAGLFAACLLLAFSYNAILLFFGFLLVRLFGQSLMPHTGMITMARAFDRHRGKALSVAASAVPLGEIVLPIVAVIFIAWIGWQQSWLVYAVLVPLVYIPLVLLTLNKNNLDHMHPSEAVESNIVDISNRFVLLKSGNFWLVLPAIMLGPFVVTGVFIHQDFVVGVKQWSSAVWAGSFIVYGVVHWLSSLSVGILIDRFSARKILPWYNLPILLSTLVLVGLNGNVYASVFLALLGISIGFSGPVSAALWAEIYGKKLLGGIRSMVTAFGVVATAISPILFGLAIDANVSLSQIAGLVAGLSLVVAIMSAFAYRDKK